MSESIREFKGEYRFLSNFYPAPIEFDGDMYPCVENAYQAAKTKDKGFRRPFLNCTAGEAKRVGRKLQLRPNWEKEKEGFMELLLLKKFSVHRDLGDKLLATGNRTLIEGNDWGDRYWGVCDGRGRNRLGFLLMRVRNQIKQVREAQEEEVKSEMREIERRF